MRRDQVFAVTLYIVGAIAGLAVVDHYLTEDIYQLDIYPWFVPYSFPVRMVVLWTVAAIPWLIVAYRKKQALSPRSLAVPITLACLIAVAVKPAQSLDLYVYLAQGRQLMYGIDPYRVTIAASVHDKVLASLNPFWFKQVSLYGPALLLVAFLANVFGPSGSVLGISKMIKAFWLIPYALWAKLCWQHWSKNRYRNYLMILIVANPLMIFHTLAEGHFDTVVAILVCTTGFLLLQERWLLASLTLCLACCFKMTAIIAAPVYACWVYSRHPKKGIVFFSGFVVSYLLTHLVIGGGEWQNAMDFARSWGYVFYAGVVPRFVSLFAGQDIDSVNLVSNTCFYFGIVLICVGTLKGKFPCSPFLAISLAFALFVFTRTHVRSWYYTAFWMPLWLCSQNPRYLTLSVGFWQIVTLMSTLGAYSTGLVEPYAVALFYLIDLGRLWRIRDVDLSEPKKMRSKKQGGLVD